jgi:hypothetical protein
MSTYLQNKIPSGARIAISSGTHITIYRVSHKIITIWNKGLPEVFVHYWPDGAHGPEWRMRVWDNYTQSYARIEDTNTIMNFVLEIMPFMPRNS